MRPHSWNKYWAGEHYSKRAEGAHYIKMMTRSFLDPDKIEMFENPVHITWTAYLEKHPIDASNICIKPFEDALIGWLIENDSPKYVPGMTVYSRIDKENPRIEVLIEEV